MPNAFHIRKESKTTWSVISRPDYHLGLLGGPIAFFSGDNCKERAKAAASALNSTLSTHLKLDKGTRK